jgi:hypothetical protein
MRELRAGSEMLRGHSTTRPPHCARRKAAHIVRGRHQLCQRSPGRSRSRRLSHFAGKLNRSTTTPSAPA